MKIMFQFTQIATVYVTVSCLSAVFVFVTSESGFAGPHDLILVKTTVLQSLLTSAYSDP